MLRGHFAMMLVVSGPDTVTEDELEAALWALRDPLDLVVAVRSIDDAVPVSPAGDPWSVSVYGADQPGIVHRITTVLAEAGANIVGLETRVIGDADRPVYAMLLEVTLPAGADGDVLAADLSAHAGALGVECSMRPSEADIF